MKKILLSLALIGTLVSCQKEESLTYVSDPQIYQFKEISAITLGSAGASEISAYDPTTKKLFVVNNSDINRIDVLDLSIPTKPVVIGKIVMAPYGGFVNSVAVSNGKLAAAIEATNKQAAGKCVVFDTKDLTEIKQITVGALPDMVTFSPDGNFIMTANEGEPSDDYVTDPEGSISIINVTGGYAVKTLNFAGFEPYMSILKKKGYRVFGPGATLVKDTEPEYITISADSKTAWVTLQENNAVAKVDLNLQVITDVFPLGFKDYTELNNAFDFSDKDSKVQFGRYPKVKGIYMPDAIAVYEKNGIPYLFTANEGDAREYTKFAEVKRVKDITLDYNSFPSGAELKVDAVLGRLNITTTLGDSDGDGDFDELYSLGARSMSVWNGNTGAQVFDTNNEIDHRSILAGLYDDNRSDDKGSEPEGIAIGKIGDRMYAFVGCERTDAVLIYDITNPERPLYKLTLKTGDAPEGILFIPADKSPNNLPLLIVSSENDGQVKCYSPIQ
jgi:DNA-binding beta-propeller fold protein YncE